MGDIRRFFGSGGVREGTQTPSPALEPPAISQPIDRSPNLSNADPPRDKFRLITVLAALKTAVSAEGSQTKAALKAQPGTRLRVICLASRQRMNVFCWRKMLRALLLGEYSWVACN